MIDLPFDDQPLSRFSLREDERTLRGGPTAAAAEPEGTIALTRPLVVPLTEALVGEDVELNAFWAAERGTYRFDYATFRCSLDPDPDRPFEKVWVELALSSAGGAEVIAWSMSPRAITDATQVTRGAKLGAKAKLISAEISEERTTEQKALFLQARGEHSARPYWLFTRTDSSAVSGMFALHLVLRSPKASPALGKISARAEISRRTFLLFSSTSEVPGPAAIDFTAAAES